MMQKFKVGNKVRVKTQEGKIDTYFNDISIIGNVTNVDVTRDYSEYPKEDKVVVVIDDLEQTVHVDDLELVEGATIDDLKLEVGKAYKSVNGKKAVVLREDSYGFLVDYGDNAAIWHRHSDGGRSNIVNSSPEFSLVSEWEEEIDLVEEKPTVDIHNTQKKTWSEMTPEEKGALLLAHHEGKVIEYSSCDSGWHLDFAFEPKGSFGHLAYRVKPKEPVVETVEMWSDNGLVFYQSPCEYEGYKITYQIVDGEPDWSTLKGETL